MEASIAITLFIKRAPFLKKRNKIIMIIMLQNKQKLIETNKKTQKAKPENNPPQPDIKEISNNVRF